MKDRRLKIGMVSMHVVASWGKEVGDKIKESLPDLTKILKQNDNFERASLEVLLYNENFEVVEDGCKVPRINLDLQLNDAKNAPQIIIPRH